jgi:FAD/FMN-containing dehydrogenase
MGMAMVAISSWGRLGLWEHHLNHLSNRHQAAQVIGAARPGLAYGMGRSYGDVCLNPGGALWKTTGLDRFIGFDEKTGCLRCESGVLLRDIQRLMVPRGWMLPVTPGTQLITVGGAIANDVHGKSHHSFGDYVRQLALLRTNGELIECGQEQHPEWFNATVGGLGLTGLILTAEIQLRPVAGPWMDAETIPYRNLDELFKLADESEAQWEYIVSWIDCISKGGRGLFMRGNHAQEQSKAPPKLGRAFTIPFVPPISLVNKLSLRPFNIAYFNLNRWRSQRSVTQHELFFYPLDNILEWNRIYGPKGFYQYQSVIPRAAGKEAVSAMLRELSHFKEGSFLTVLKTFGANQKPVGMLSFPQPAGVTFAIDFLNKGEKTLKLFERLDAIVHEAGGRLYLAKDARMSRHFFEASYPELARFLPYRDAGISSAMSRRLMGA